MRKNFKKIFTIAIIAAAMCTAVPAKSPAQAFGATIVLIDLKQFALELTKSFAASMLNNVTNRYVITFANKAVAAFQIKKPNAYNLNLANQIYTNPALKDLPTEDQFIIKTTINAINGVGGTPTDLSALYTKKALDVCNPQAVNSVPAGVQTYTTLSACANPNSLPVMQETNFKDKSAGINTTSRQKAQADINSGQGYKSTYTCTESLTVAEACAISKSANLIDGRVNGLIDSAFHNESNPAGDKYTQYFAAMGKAVGNALATSLFTGNTNGLSNNLINDVVGLPLAVGAQAANGGGGTGGGTLKGPPFSLTQFMAGNDQNILIAGFGTSPVVNAATVAPGSSVTLEWDASALAAKGADHVIFSNGDHSIDTTRPLSSFTHVVANGIVNYTLTVVNAKGTVLVSDTIGISDGSG